MPRPAAQVQIHHRTSGRKLPRRMSRTMSAIAHPAVMTLVTSWSLPSSGGGGDRRVPCSRVCFTPVGYEVVRVAASVRGRDVLSPRFRLPDEGLPSMTTTRTRTDAGLATALRISVSRLARRLRAQRAVSGMTEAVLSETQLAALSALEVHHAMTPGVIAVLTERNLVLKSPHPRDRRQVILTVTGEGRAVVQSVRRRKDAWLAQRLAELTSAERATLRAAVPILEKLSQS